MGKIAQLAQLEEPATRDDIQLISEPKFRLSASVKEK